MARKRVSGFLTFLWILLIALAGEAHADTSSPLSADPAGSIPLRLPIIMYHEVKTYKAGKDVILPWEFENDLKYLQENNFTTIHMGELIDSVYNGTALPDHPIILSFDDGYLNNYVYVFPLLQKYNMKIVFSIIGKNTDDFTDIPDDNLDYSHVTWDQLREMAASGSVEVQNHTYNMHKPSERLGCKRILNETEAEYEQALTADLMKLQELITSVTDHTPTTFVYPYGKCSDTTVPILRRMGFKASLSCDYGINLITGNPDELFGLKRICRSHNLPLSQILKKEGCLTIAEGTCDGRRTSGLSANYSV